MHWLTVQLVILCILPCSEVLPVSRSTSRRIPKITNYTLSQYIMCEYCIELTQLVWDKRVIVNFMYPPLLRGPPCCKVHQWEGTKFRVGQSHDLPYGVLNWDL